MGEGDDFMLVFCFEDPCLERAGVRHAVDSRLYAVDVVSWLLVRFPLDAKTNGSESAFSFCWRRETCHLARWIGLLLFTSALVLPPMTEKVRTV